MHNGEARVVQRNQLETLGKSVMMETTVEPKKKIEKRFDFKDWIIIDPMTMKYQIFKLIVVVDTIYSSLFYAVFAAFRVDMDYGSRDVYLLSLDAAFFPVTAEAVRGDVK